MSIDNPSNIQTRKQKLRHRQLRHQAWQLIAIIAITGLAIIGLFRLIQIGYSQEWTELTGFNEFTYPKDSNKEFARAKTLWDWLNLLIVPTVLAIGALLFNRAERVSDRKIARARDKTERAIATNKAQEALLQSYLDHMTKLVIDKGLNTTPPRPEVEAIAKARTITILQRLDRTRRDSLLTLLAELRLTELLAEANLPEANLTGADLSRANLTRANLTRARLNEANLTGADLTKANLTEAYLTRANLTRANLNEANLTGAYLIGTDLTEAYLIGADLTGADLTRANLSGANLSGADLTFANLTKAQIQISQLNDTKSHQETIMPDTTVNK